VKTERRVGASLEVVREGGKGLLAEKNVVNAYGKLPTIIISITMLWRVIWLLVYHPLPGHHDHLSIQTSQCGGSHMNHVVVHAAISWSKQLRVVKTIPPRIYQTTSSKLCSSIPATR
jgi:hypothetical protein